MPARASAYTSDGSVTGGMPGNPFTAAVVAECVAGGVLMAGLLEVGLLEVDMSMPAMECCGAAPGAPPPLQPASAPRVPTAASAATVALRRPRRVVLTRERY